MKSPQISRNVNIKNNQNGYHVNEGSNKFDFGRCKICKDKATGIHYGIPSCEGCKVIIIRIFRINSRLYYFENEL